MEFKKVKLTSIDRFDELIGNKIGDIVEVRQYLDEDNGWFLDGDGNLYTREQLEFIEK